MATETATDQVLEILRGKLRMLMNDTSDVMINGRCKSFPDYTHMTGVVEGLALAERELLDLDAKLRNE